MLYVAEIQNEGPDFVVHRRKWYYGNRVQFDRALIAVTAIASFTLIDTSLSTTFGTVAGKM